MLWSIVLGCALLGQADAKKDAAPAVDAEQQKLQKDVDGLIKRILRGNLNQRQQAEQKLIALGHKALEALPPTKDDTPDVLKDVLKRVRRVLEKQAAETAGKATLITLAGEMPLSQAMAALQKQSGNAILDQRGQFQQPETDPKIKLVLEKVPFWQALDQVLDAAGMDTYLYNEKVGVGFVVRDEGAVPQKERPVAYSGPFRIEAVELLSRRDFRNPARQRMSVKLETFWEPRLRPIHVALPMDTIRATDENGKSVPVAIMGAAEAEVIPGTSFAELQFPFALPGRDVKKIASLKGTMQVLVPGKVGTYEFAKLDRNQKKPRTQEQSGVKVLLERIRKNADVWEIRVTLSFEKAEGGLASHRDWVFNNETHLLDAAGKRVDYDGFESVKRTESEVGVAYYYDLANGPDGMTLVYKTPSMIMKLPVEFEIKNVELP